MARRPIVVDDTDLLSVYLSGALSGVDSVLITAGADPDVREHAQHMVRDALADAMVQDEILSMVRDMLAGGDVPAHRCIPVTRLDP